MSCLCSLCGTPFTDPDKYMGHACFRDADGGKIENEPGEGLNGELVNRRVLSYWEAEKQWYKAIFVEFDKEAKSYKWDRSGLRASKYRTWDSIHTACDVDSVHFIYVQIEYDDGDFEESIMLPESTIFVFQEGQGFEKEVPLKGKKRGRPCKIKDEVPIVVKRGPGRPSRTSVEKTRSRVSFSKPTAKESGKSKATSDSDPTKTTKGRGKKQTSPPGPPGCGAGFERGGQGCTRCYYFPRCAPAWLPCRFTRCSPLEELQS
eukprot:204199-Prorocentrum_minimum.AAC.2